MTDTALAKVTPEQAAALIPVSQDQIDVIKATIAPDATDAELKLFVYDCQRRGVHPLDKLIHFTKRKGKYVPVTSIDFLRSRAAATDQHVGTTDPEYQGAVGTEGYEASVTVFKLVAGERVPFQATARWREFSPEDEKNAFMWKKMPAHMLGKCAEALALRKAFPQELSQLPIVEEMMKDVNAGGSVVQQPRRTSERGAATVDGAVVVDVKIVDAKTKEGVGKTGTTWRRVDLKGADGQTYKFFEDKLPKALALVKAAREAGAAVRIGYKTSEYGRDVVSLDAVPEEQPPADDREPGFEG